jgi:ion channel
LILRSARNNRVGIGLGMPQSGCHYATPHREDRQTMLIRLLQGGLLLALTVTIHAVVLSVMLNVLNKRYRDNVRLRTVAYVSLLIRIAAVTVFAHLLEIALWAAFFVWQGALPDLETGFYFSSVTYATIGYGDVVLPETWRLIAAIEGLTGILMCGWSAAFFFAVVNKFYARAHPGQSEG